MTTEFPDRRIGEFVEVSPEMTTLLGPGLPGMAPLPPNPIAIHYSLGEGLRPSTLRLAANARLHPHQEEAASLVLIVDTSAFLRVGGQRPCKMEMAGVYLPSGLVTIARALRDCPMSGEGRKVYQLAKSIELLCETIRFLAEGHPIPVNGTHQLSMKDSRRLHEARRMIDEQWNEKLTISSISRACGLNRAKLTRGFRALFHCSVAEAIAEKRLGEARRMLLDTDLPVAAIAYENGYLNNASFARAFSRRFGVPPSAARACRSPG